MSGKSPAQRSLAWLREQGWLAVVVERWNAHARIRQDLLGCGDLLALREGDHALLIQVTSTSNLSARQAKALQQPGLRLWLMSGNRFTLHGWSKKGPRGQLKKWTLTTREITIADLPPVPIEDTRAS